MWVPFPCGNFVESFAGIGKGVCARVRCGEFRGEEGGEVEAMGDDLGVELLEEAERAA